MLKKLKIKNEIVYFGNKFFDDNLDWSLGVYLKTEINKFGHNI